MQKKIYWQLILLILMCINQPVIAAIPVAAKKGMVVSEQRIASEIGATILREGGNAIDAAVAVGYALAVVDPCCGNLGGGGFMVAHLANGQNIFLNFRETAPQKAHKKMFLKKGKLIDENASVRGYLAVAVPGTVLGLDTALQKYGTFSRAKVMAPAIQLAEQGFIMTPNQVKVFSPYTTAFQQQKNIAAVFLKQNKPLQSGDRLVQKELADTLRQIAQHGPRYFYQGPIAKKIVAASTANGGILTLADFANYRVQFLKPIICRYHQYTLISAAPPSAGGITLCEILNILENFSLTPATYQSPENIREIIEAMRYGFADRNYQLGDPKFVNNPTAYLTSKAYAKSISKKIRAHHQVKSAPLSFPQRVLTDTTHYSIADKEGNAVALTYTLNGFFGAKVMAEGTGFFLNDEMDDFATLPGSPNKFGLVQYDANNIQPGKRPLSSMSPTIVLKNGKLFMVIGSPGGPRIISALLLTILNVVNYGMNLQEAANAPRFHYQGVPDIVDFEFATLPAPTLRQLQRWGYRLMIEHQSWAAIAAILRQNKMYYGAMDRRRPDGAAVGVN